MFTGQAVGGLLRERDDAGEVLGQLVEELQAALRVQAFAAQHGLRGQARFVGGDLLSQTRLQVGMLTEGIEPVVGQHPFQVRPEGPGAADDHRAGNQVAQALAVTRQQRRQPPDPVQKNRWHEWQLQRGQCVDETHEVPKQDLAEGQAKGVYIHDAQAKDFLTDGPATPPPLQADPIAEVDCENPEEHQHQDDIASQQRGQQKQEGDHAQADQPDD